MFDGTYDTEKSTSTGTIQFTPLLVKSYDEDLIEFVRIHTKKMRSLIFSDLDALVTEIKEFTNIGNPWYLEGIGTFKKNRAGAFEFTQGEPVAQKLEDRRISPTEEITTGRSPDKYYVDNASRSTIRSILSLLLVVGGLGVICWGGYYLYTQYMAAKQETPVLTHNGNINNGSIPDNDLLFTDSIEEDNSLTKLSDKDVVTLPDSSSMEQPASPEIKRWKFVLRKGNKEVIEKRYQQLKGFNKPVMMEATDQLEEYIVYLILDVAAKDTLRVRDSLKIHYNDPIDILPL